MKYSKLHGLVRKTLIRACILAYSTACGSLSWRVGVGTMQHVLYLSQFINQSKCFACLRIQILQIREDNIGGIDDVVSLREVAFSRQVDL